MIAGIEVKRLMSKVTFDDWIDDDDEHRAKRTKERAALGNVSDRRRLLPEVDFPPSALPRLFDRSSRTYLPRDHPLGEPLSLSETTLIERLKPGRGMTCPTSKGDD